MILAQTTVNDTNQKVFFLQEMQEKLQNFAQLPAHRVTDSCIVALLSHGVEGGIYGVDGKLLQVCVSSRV